jgi:HK97 family phage major capsid protein
MTLKEAQEKFRKSMSDADAIRNKYQGKSENMTTEEETQWTKHLDEAEGHQRVIKQLQREEALKAFGKESAGTLPLAGKSRKDEEGDPLEPEGDDDTARGVKDFMSYVDPKLARAIKATKKPTYVESLTDYIRAKGQLDFLSTQARKDLSEGVDSEGGFFVPEDFRSEIIKKVATMAEVRGRARIIPTSRDVVTFPLEDYSTDDKYSSAMRMTWVDENPSSDTETDSSDNDPGQLHIYVRTGMAGKKISNNLIEDGAFDILAYVQELLGEAFGLGENDAFLTGNGIAKPNGLFNSANPQFPSTVNSGHASQVTADGVIDLFYGLPKQYRKNAVFMFNSQTAKALRKLKDGQNRYLWDALNGGLASRGDQDTLLNKEVVIDEFAPDIAANSYPIAFGDFKGYYVVDRVGMSIQILREKYAERNQIKVLGRKRLGGQVAEKFRFRIQKIAA